MAFSQSRCERKIPCFISSDLDACLECINVPFLQELSIVLALASSIPRATRSTHRRCVVQACYYKFSSPISSAIPITEVSYLNTQARLLCRLCAVVIINFAYYDRFTRSRDLLLRDAVMAFDQNVLTICIIDDYAYRHFRMSWYGHSLW